MLSTRYWKRLGQFTHPEIIRALEMLPKMVESSRQTNTVKCYLGAYQRFEQWASALPEVLVFPTNDMSVTIYMLALVQQGKSIAVIQQFLFSTAWIHSVAGYPNPTNNNMVHTVLEGAKRLITTPSQRKEPITPEVLLKILHHLQGSKKTLTLTARRMMALILLAYSAFLRCEEALTLRRSHIRIHTTHMDIYIPSSKTDQYREGRSVLVARTRTALDHVLHMYKYLQAARIIPMSEEYIFQAISSKGPASKQVLRKEDKHISYTTIRDLLKKLLRDIGLDEKRYGTHSLRAGGATAAALHDVPDRLFKKHGRWASDSSKDRYVKESLEQRLRVTLQLGL